MVSIWLFIIPTVLMLGMGAYACYWEQQATNRTIRNNRLVERIYTLEDELNKARAKKPEQPGMAARAMELLAQEVDWDLPGGVDLPRATEAAGPEYAFERPLRTGVERPWYMVGTEWWEQ